MIYFIQILLSLLIGDTALGLEANLNHLTHRFHSQRNIENVMVSRTPYGPAQELGEAHHYTSPPGMPHPPTNMQIFFAQQEGRVSQINYNARYNHIQALLQQDHHAYTTCITLEAIPQGYRVRIPQNFPGSQLLPVSGSYQTDDGQTHYFLVNRFFQATAEGFQADPHILLPHHRPLIDTNLLWRIANNEDFEHVLWGEDGTLDIVPPHGREVVHINLFNIAQLTGHRVIRFWASTVLFNKASLTGMNLDRRQVNAQQAQDNPNTVAKNHHSTNQLFVDPATQTSSLNNRERQQEHAIPTTLPEEKLKVSESLIEEEKKHTPLLIAEHTLNEFNQLNTQIRDLFVQVRAGNQNVIQELKKIVDNPENLHRIAPYHLVNGYCALIRNGETQYRDALQDMFAFAKDQLTISEYLSLLSQSERYAF